MFQPIELSPYQNAENHEDYIRYVNQMCAFCSHMGQEYYKDRGFTLEVDEEFGGNQLVRTTADGHRTVVAVTQDLLDPDEQARIEKAADDIIAAEEHL